MKPGAGVVTLTATTKTDTSKLTKEDLVVFWAGTNSTAQNACTKGLKYSNT